MTPATSSQPPTQKAVLRLFIASDLHGSDRALSTLPRKAAELEDGPADATVLCGDLTHLGRPRDFLKKLCPQLPQPVLAIPGNVDPPEVLQLIADAGAECLHDRRMVLAGVTLVGFGGTGPTPVHNRFVHSDEEIGRRLDALWPEQDSGPVVLVVHGPAKGRLDRAFKLFSVGSQAVAELVDRRRPQVVLSGHIHESRGIHQEKHSLFLNPGPGTRGHAAVVEVAREPTGSSRAWLL